MSNLHAALLEAITARQERAQAVPPGPWPASTGCDCLSCGFIAAESPDAVFRQCERDLKVLARHAAGDQKGGDDTVACAGCTHSNFSAWECWSAWPCIEVSDLAEAYAIPVDATAGQTPGGTDG